MAKVTKEQALEYHRYPRPGKIEVIPTKPYSTQNDLALAYSPGVAYPCLEIQEHPQDAYKYTDKGNLVAVISNGTAVLGLGDIGPLAGKPVMEGKGLLFKILPASTVSTSKSTRKTPRNSSPSSRPSPPLSEASTLRTSRLRSALKSKSA